MLGTVLPLSAQQKQEALYVFRNDGQFNAFFFADIDRFEYSRVDTFGVEHDKFVVQEVHTIDSIFRIPLSAIDSVAFVTPETKYKQDVILPDASISDYIVASDSSNWFRLSANTPASMIPKKGSKIVIAQRSKYLPKGLGGIIANVEQSSNGYTVTMGETDLCDIYDKLVINIAAETPEEGNARGRADGEETELLKQPIVIPPIEGTFGLEGSLDVLSGINKKIDKYVEASMDGAGEISFKLTPKIKSLRTTVYADGFFTRYSFYALTELKFETSAAVQIGGTGRVKAPAFSIEVDPVKDKDGNISKFGLSMEIAPYVEVSGSTSLKYNSEQVSEYHVASNIGGLGLIPGLWFESNQVSSKTETTTCEKSFSIGIGISAKTEAHVGFFEGLKVKTAFSVDLGMKFISDDPVSRDKIRATELFETPPLYTLLNKDNLVRVEDTLFGLTTSISFGRLSVPTIIKIGNKVELFHFGRVPNFRAIGWMPNERCPWKGQIEMSFTPREVLSNTPYGFTIKDVKEDKVIETHWFEKPYNSEKKDSKKYEDFFETSKLYRVYPLTKHHDEIIVGDQESEFSLGAPVIDIKDRYVEFDEKWAMKDDSLITNVANVQFTSEKEWLKARYDRDVAVVTLTAEDLPDENDIRRCNVIGIGYDKEGKEIVRNTINVAQLRPVIGSRYAEFDTKAGEQTVKIYTTVGNMKYSFANIFDNNPDDFCSFKVVNDSTLIVSVKENKGVKRTAIIDIKGTSPNGQYASGSLTVIQEGTKEEKPDTTTYLNMFTGGYVRLGASFDNDKGKVLYAGLLTDNSGLVSVEGDKLIYNYSKSGTFERDTSHYVKSEFVKGKIQCNYNETIRLVLLPDSGNNVSQYVIESGHVTYDRIDMYDNKNVYSENWLCDLKDLKVYEGLSVEDETRISFNTTGTVYSSDDTDHVPYLSYTSSNTGPLSLSKVQDLTVVLSMPNDYPTLSVCSNYHECDEYSKFENGDWYWEETVLHPNLKDLKVTSSDDWIKANFIERGERMSKLEINPEENKEETERSGFICVQGTTNDGQILKRYIRIKQRGNSIHHNGDEKAILPSKNILDFLKDYMPIYEGDTPPDLDGKTFDMSPLSVCFDFDGETSSRASGIVLTFGHWLSLGGANQDVRHYPYVGGKNYAASEHSYHIQGSGQNFTLGYVQETQTKKDGNSEKYYNSIVISGTLTSKGVENMYMVIIHREQINDGTPKTPLTILKDADGLSIPAAWNPGGTLFENR